MPTAPLPLVLIHAYPFSSAMWEKQRDGVGREVRLITPDLPGFGGSSRLDGELLSMEIAARRVIDELDLLEIDRFVLGGLSMGGYVTFELLRLQPQRIAGLLLADTRATPDSDEGRRSRFEAIERIGSGDWLGYVEELSRRLLAPVTVTERPEILAEVRRLMLTTPQEVAMAALVGMSQRRDASDLLGEVKVPVEVVVGEDDLVTPAEEVASMAASISDAGLTRIESAGHLCNLEQPERFNAVVTRLMERVAQAV